VPRSAGSGWARAVLSRRKKRSFGVNRMADLDFSGTAYIACGGHG
jgi:hypothetical protein